MFKKILIANRGEIACRVIRTARRMGIATVAVYSDADADALHVRQADEAVHIGPPPAADSYLRIDRILEACRATRAETVHPGYGFLSENAQFAAALEKAAIVFIGPDARAISALGDKIAAKKLAAAAGVSTVPGHLDAIADAEQARRIARDIGYPVMIKAAAGGGGKGMRIARNDAEIREGFRAAGNEARASFADGRVFIEKYIEEPRHIEIQILADAHGTVVYLFERECSIQRRHQKVIEEAPSPFLDAKTRAAMGAQAVALASAAGYRSAGTAEFIVDRERNFYFLEMNTRLQVEHPVTEMVTGLDLVELMIRIAAGEKLPFAQKDLRLQGSAIEARVYAEDPTRNFLPSVGRLVRYIPPEGEGIRVDSGVEEGAEISLYYDPMIAKLVAYGDDREAAIVRLGAALDGFHIRGPSHNLGFLSAVIANKRFRAGRLSTGFIAEEFPEGFSGKTIDAAAKADALAVAAAVQCIVAEHAARIDGQISGRSRPPPVDWTICVGEPGDEAQRHAARVMRAGESITVEIAGKSRTIATTWQPWQPLLRVAMDGTQAVFQIARDGIGMTLSRGGASLRVMVVPPRTAELLVLMAVKPPPDLSRFLLSPMPGLLVSLAVSEGQRVKAGEELAVVEAMKMENLLRAERDGEVLKIHATPGASLAVDQVILEFA
ncbi:MAG TPA: acetyl/propionyl/methylcrotonyl-CoA carboxylase subunit alpha [Stellaceae bacterium]|nr:acetyl/propionyl/methylcrotonyl-CoA carboxylase subunit alpha [Stellaceae bacterium]